jgi:hypothetical protein
MLRLYVTLVRSKLEYACVVWNSITSTDANKLECIQQRFAAFCFNCFFPQVHYCYSFVLVELKLYPFHMRRHRLDAFFLFQVYFGSKFCPSVLEFVVLWVPARYIRDFLCSMSAPRVKIAPLLDVHQLLILSARKLRYLDSGIFSFVIYFNILKLLLLLFNILLESLLILSFVLT